VDGARELLGRGFDPATPLTMRMEGNTYDSFQPLPIGEWAKWTYAESEERALRRVPWMPFPTPRSGQKSGSEPSVVPNPIPRQIRFYERPSWTPARHRGLALINRRERVPRDGRSIARVNKAFRLRLPVSHDDVGDIE
jgi:hypothetical protein